MAFYRQSPWKGERRRRYGLAACLPYVLNQRREITSDPDVDPFSAQTRQNREKTVCFTGHRRIGEPEQTALEVCRLLETLYQQGYRDFISGAALGFDQLAARCVVALRARHRDVRLILAIPCPDQSQPWSVGQAQDYEQLIYLCDETRVLSPYYYDGCMQVRNRYMVDRASLCIAYMKHTGRSGTIATMRYALSQDVPIVNVAVPGAVQEYIGTTIIRA